jgi:hypothetical protein
MRLDRARNTMMPKGDTETLCWNAMPRSIANKGIVEPDHPAQQFAILDPGPAVPHHGVHGMTAEFQK